MQTWTGTPSEWQQQLLNSDSVRPRYVITATSRLAQRLRNELQDSGQSLTPAPQIMDYRSWLQYLWSVLCWQLPKPLRLLTDIQVQQVWRRVLLASDLDILNPMSVIPLAIQTYQSLRAYRLPDADWQHFSSGDVRWFCQAYRQYLMLLQQHHYLDPADLPNALITADMRSYLQQVDIDWLGFVEHTPEQLALMRHLSGAQHRQIHWQMTSTSVARLTCVDTLDEFQQALTWAMSLTQTSLVPQSSLDPHAEKKLPRVAIVVPELQKYRAELLRETLRWQHQQVLPVISFSGGEPLAQLPLFKTLFSALCLLQTPWQLQDVLRLCRSTFIGEALVLPESLHTQLPQSARPEIFQNFLSAQDLKPTWLAILRQQLEQVSVARALSHWCDFAQALLLQLQWPGSLMLNSTDYQAVQKITQLLNTLRTADPFDDPWIWSDFLLLLQQQAQQRLFQPESPDCQIQVLGLWEAVGQTFDGLWVMGLHQDAWPRPTRLLPFLSREVQLAHQLPRVCPQQEWALAQQMLQQWQKSSLQLVISFAEQDGAAHQSASPLIVDFLPMNPLPVLCTVAPSLLLQKVSEISVVIDADEKIRGGSAILAAQAQCPFQSFARFRLRVKTVEETVVGLSAQERGILVHSCLEMFWRQHQQQDALKALSAEQLQQQLQTIIHAQLKTRQLKQSTALNNALLCAEQQRLLNLLTQWLQMEKLRTPFKVIALEQAIEVQLADMQLSVRLDRMDQLETGESVLIDYKTGAVNLQDWWHQPCLAPQLPLYALTVSPRADAIVYGVVTLPKPMLKGLGSAALQVYDDAPRYLQQAVDALEDWPDLQSRWQQDIHQLAQDFSQGVVDVQPINGDATCVRCGLQGLCRVNSLSY